MFIHVHQSYAYSIYDYFHLFFFLVLKLLTSPCYPRCSVLTSPWRRVKRKPGWLLVGREQNHLGFYIIVDKSGDKKGNMDSDVSNVDGFVDSGLDTFGWNSEIGSVFAYLRLTSWPRIENLNGLQLQMYSSHRAILVRVMVARFGRYWKIHRIQV